MPYTVRLTFTDKNAPQMRQKCASRGDAMATLLSWSRRIAGIHRLEIFEPDGTKHLYDGSGEYHFTISAEVAKQFNLKP